MVWQTEVKRPDGTVDTFYYNTLKNFDYRSGDPFIAGVKCTPLDDGEYFGRLAYEAVNADDPSATSWESLNGTKIAKWKGIANTIVNAYANTLQ